MPRVEVRVVPAPKSRDDDDIRGVYRDVQTDADERFTPGCDDDVRGVASSSGLRMDSLIHDEDTERQLNSCLSEY